MSVLEIVLVSILSFIIVFGAIYLLVFRTNKTNRLQIFTEVSRNPIKQPIVFFGDSLTDFFPIQDFFPTYPIYNRGVAGDRTRDLIHRIDDVIHLQPKKIFIQIGTNDLGEGIRPTKIIENIDQIYKRLKKDIPGVELIAISLYPVSHHKMWLSPIIAGIRSNKQIVKTNQLLAKLCATHHIPLIDLHAQLVDKKKRLNSQYTLEGLHISGRGYSVIASAIRPYLEDNQ